RDQLLEEVALGAVGEAVELQRVLADDQVRLHDQLVRSLRPPQHARRGRNEVPDAVDVDDELVRPARDGTSAQPGDHEATALSRGGASAWQIATASASAACEGLGSALSPRIACTIRCTCAFSARP